MQDVEDGLSISPRPCIRPVRAQQYMGSIRWGRELRSLPAQVNPARRMRGSAVGHDPSRIILVATGSAARTA